MEKFIHIHAKCKGFEVFEQVPEKKAVSRLIKIRNNFNWFKGIEGFTQDKLVVNTKLVNPEFQFS